MKKFLFLLALFFSLSPFLSFAEDCSLDNTSVVSFIKGCGDKSSGLNFSTENQNTIEQRVALIAKGAISLGALLAVGAIVWAGIQYAKAFGDDEKLKKAKTTGIYALIGLLLMMASFSLVDIFINFLFKITQSA